MLKLAADLAVPVSAVTETLAILGIRGAGKSATAGVLVEELDKQGLQVVVFDPTGGWWGIRAAADGRGPGRSIVVLGGEHGDIPIEASGGALVADFVTDERVSVVVDFSDLSLSGQRQFVVDFAERLWQRKARARDPLHLVLDECDEVVPQRVMREQARMVGAIERLVKRGRIRGIGVSLLSQRPAAVNKDVLSQTGTLIALRTISGHDVDAIEHWIERHVVDLAQRQAVLSSLASLPNGCGWIWSPSWLGKLQKVQFRQRETFDSSATPVPGQTVRQPKQLAEVDLAALHERMETTVRRAADADPRVLRRRVVELEHQLAARAPIEKTREKTVTVEKAVDRPIPVVDAKLLARAAGAVEKLLALHNKLAEDLQTARVTLEYIEEAARWKRRLEEPPPPTRAPIRAPARVMSAVPITVARPDGARGNGAPAGAPPAGADSLSAYARQLLQTAARHRPMRLSRTQIAVLAGRSTRSSAFDGAMASLLRTGLLGEGHDGLYGLTAVGEDAAGDPGPAGDPVAVWRQALPRYERTLLDALLAAGGELSREDLAARAGRSLASSAFQGAISTLIKNALATAEGGRVYLSDLLRPAAF